MLKRTHMALPLESTPHLIGLSQQVEQALAGEHPEVLAAVRDAQNTWKGLHDRLIAIIVGFLDDAVQQGSDLAELLERVRLRTTVGVPNTATAAPDPHKIAALLRSHGAVGSVHVTESAVVFEHACGSGQQYWRNHPETPKTREGEVPGVPAGLPRYCARCIDTVDALGTAGWLVTPPSSLEERCRWTVPVSIQQRFADPK
ncbi:MAG: hypothetical protein ACKOJH_11735 [Actinomycetota bacterium]